MVLQVIQPVRRYVGPLMFVLAMMVATPASAFECTVISPTNQTTLVWPEREIHWVVEREVLEEALNGSEALQDVQASFNAWTSVACSDLAFVFDGVVEEAAAEFDTGENDVNAVVWVGSGWPHETDAIAVTTSAFDPRNGRVVDADIELNGQQFQFTRVGGGCDPRGRTMDIANTLTHEVGHVLGLEHPPDRREFELTTMFASAPTCETIKRTLAQDDINGVCFIYPSGAATQRCSGQGSDLDEADSGCTHTQRTDGSWAGSAWAWLAIGALLLWRRRFG